MTEQNPNRKFIPSQGADDHAEFDRIMHEIHPKKIPAHFVDKIKLFHKNGRTSLMTKDDIYNTIPVCLMVIICHLIFGALILNTVICFGE
jgi:hypothetical protein